MQKSKLIISFLSLLFLLGCPEESKDSRLLVQQINASANLPIDHDEEVNSAYKKAMHIRVSKLWLWHLTKGTESFYVFGTIHGGVGLNEIPDCLKSAVRNSSLVMNELSYSSNDNTKEESIFVPTVINRKLKDSISPQKWQIFLKMVEVEESLINDIDEQSARLLLISIASGRQEKYLRMDHLDASLATLAVEAKIPLKGLETVNDRNKIYSEWLTSLDSSENKSLGLDAILDTYGLNYYTQSLVMLYAVVEAYKNGEESSLQKAFSRYSLLMEPYPEEVLAARNRLWGETIKKEKSMDNAFIAVGLAHLLGPGSFLDILESQGWKSQRITSC